jgi:hypothetical protein
MRFSDIKDNPRDYDRSLMLQKLKDYFTLPTKDLDIPVDQTYIPLTLTKETTGKAPVLFNKDDRRVTLAYIVGLYDGTRDDGVTFSDRFLQSIMCGIVTNYNYRDRVSDRMQTLYLENTTGLTSEQFDAIFTPYIEDTIDDFTSRPILRLNYKFDSRDCISIRLNHTNAYDTADIEIRRSDLTSQWVLTCVSDEALAKFKEDLKVLQKRADEQPTTVTRVIKGELDENLRPYLDRLTSMATTVKANTHSIHSRQWLKDHDDTSTSYDDYGDTLYKLTLDVSLSITHDGDAYTVTCPIEKGMSLVPAETVLKDFETDDYLAYYVKRKLKPLYIKDLVLKGLASKKTTLHFLLERLDENDEALTFVEDDNRYQLRSRRGVITYERNGYTMMTFTKEDDRFKMSLRDSHLLNEHVYFNVENLVTELIDKL